MPERHPPPTQASLKNRKAIRGVEPYKLHPAPPELALLLPDGKVLRENGTQERLRRVPSGVQVWGSQAVGFALLRQGKGSAICWRGQPIRYQDGGRAARIVALEFPDDPAESLAGLGSWRDWLASYGAAPCGSLGSSSMSLLRATLADPLWTTVPASDAPPLTFTIGGRQEEGPAGAPATFGGELGHFDLRAAYASRLGGLEYGGWWHRIDPGHVLRHAAALHAAGKMVFVRARVRLAGSSPGPLVRRPRSRPAASFLTFAEYPREGVIQGVWTMGEVQTAADHGAHVVPLGGWFHSNGGELPFAPWWRAVEDGRRMRGLAGVLAKATGNALWGQFCITEEPSKQMLFYRRERGQLRRVLVNLPTSGRRPPAHDLAEYLTGSVRAELYGFMAAAGGRLVSAHTDGAWSDAGGGWKYGDWRLKDRAEELRLLDAQTIAYRRPGEKTVRYVVAGYPADGAADEFERRWLRRERRETA